MCSLVKRLHDVFGLDDIEIDQLLRSVDIASLADLIAILERRLIADRIPDVIRSPDDWLGGRTILETLQTDGVAPVMAYLDRLFSYGPE
jgi:hypothetical protein